MSVLIELKQCEPGPAQSLEGWLMYGDEGRCGECWEVGGREGEVMERLEVRVTHREGGREKLIMKVIVDLKLMRHPVHPKCWQHCCFMTN